MSRKLRRSDYSIETVALARSLLGCTLHHETANGPLAGVIVETEAYLGANDPASHARRGLRSKRNESMYLRVGHAYVYFTYGMHYCMNVVAGEEGIPEAVLIRAVEPFEGVERMRQNRPAARRDRDLTNGPGKLCAAMEIDRDLDGVDLTRNLLWITKPSSPVDESSIGVSTRIGIEGSGEAAHWPLRFFLRDNEFVSRHRRRKE
ncbi:MAG: DNA-3-methyladenine glycosylase [Acidobacteria bacterium]|nr:DNA-3-methyladenine glycosylase [Acidobacteriota bacterium]